jgi:hypothetical protein
VEGSVMAAKFYALHSAALNGRAGIHMPVEQNRI